MPTAGYAELLVAVWAGAGDTYDQYRLHVMKDDEAIAQGVSDTKRFFYVFLPAFADIGLAFLDYFVFTTQADADAASLWEAIRNNVVSRRRSAGQGETRHTDPHRSSTVATNQSDRGTGRDPHRTPSEGAHSARCVGVVRS